MNDLMQANSNSNKIITINNQLSDNEGYLIELQGQIEHTIEHKYYDMNLGKLEQRTNVIAI